MLNKSEIIKQLEQKAADIETLAINFINNAPLKHFQRLNTYSWDKDNLPHDLLEVQQKLISNYISWFNSSEELVKKEIPDKIEEFKKYYNKEGVTTQLFFQILKRSNISILVLLDILLLRDILEDINYYVVSFNPCFIG